MIGRRDFIAMLSGAVVAWPHGAPAQQRERMRRIGMLIGVPLDDPINRPANDALIDELTHLGWIRDENYRLDIRSANGGGAPGFRAGARELVALAPDVIVVAAEIPTGHQPQDRQGDRPLRAAAAVHRRRRGDRVMRRPGPVIVVVVPAMLRSGSQADGRVLHFCVP
jgi:hypothetical protein